MRVSDSARYDLMKDQLSRVGTSLDRAVEQLSSGRKINRLSDDPDQAVVADKLRVEVAAIDAYSRAADNARGWLATQDNALQGGLSLLERARELAISAAKPMSAESRNAIAAELESIRDQLVEVANTRFDGRSVFGGFANTAVTAGPGGVSLVDDGGSVRRRVSETLVVSINVSAADVFGFSGSRDVFSALDDVIGATRAGDLDAISGTGVADLINAHDVMNSHLGKVGSITNGIDSAQRATAGRRDAAEQLRSSIVDVDFAESAVELTRAETAYQAVLAATARLEQPSLMDYLR